MMTSCEGLAEMQSSLGLETCFRTSRSWYATSRSHTPGKYHFTIPREDMSSKHLPIAVKLRRTRDACKCFSSERYQIVSIRVNPVNQIVSIHAGKSGPFNCVDTGESGQTFS